MATKSVWVIAVQGKDEYVTDDMDTTFDVASAKQFPTALEAQSWYWNEDMKLKTPTEPRAVSLT